MRLIPLTSSQIASIGFLVYDGTYHDGDAVLGILGVQFQNGACYKYHDVPMIAFVGVITDPDSQGKAFNRIIKKGNDYPYAASTLEEIAEL